jgi:hypothetical protein
MRGSATNRCGELHEGNGVAAADKGVGYRPLGPLYAPRCPGEPADMASDSQLASSVGEYLAGVFMGDLADAAGV